MLRTMRWFAGFGGCGLVLLVACADVAPERAPESPELVVLRDGNNPLQARMYVFRDDTGDRRFADLRRAPPQTFHAMAPNEHNIGHSSAAYWVRFRVKNAAASSSFILAFCATPEIAEVYTDAEEPSGAMVARSGTSLPFSKRPVADGDIAFRITLSAHEDRTFWVRLTSQDTITLDAWMWTEPAFWRFRGGKRLLHGAYYGALTALAAYNLFLYLFVRRRDRNYLLYVVFQLTTGLAQAAIDRYAFEYLWPGHPGWAMRSIPALEFLSVAAALAFAREFLDIRRLSRRLDAVMRVLFVAAVVQVAMWGLVDLSALAPAGGHGPVTVLVMIAALLGGALILSSAVVVAVAAGLAVARTRSTNAGVFLGAWLVLLAGTAMASLHALGAMDSFDGFELIKLGSGLEAVLLSLALASRINALTRDRERAQQELLAANASRIEGLRRLISGVAHEIGNPLNYARGGCDALGAQLDASGPVDPGGKTPVRRAHKLVTSGLSRIQLILDNLRRYLSVGDAAPVTTDLAHEIEDALALARDRMRASDVELETEIGELPRLQARPGQLHQVMLNLIANAIEAMPGGGVLRVVAHAGDDAVEIAVADTGSGIAPADRERVFEPFFTTRAEGTGLGLAVAREIVKVGGGTLRVRDVVGGGAMLVVSLPRPQRESR